MTNTQQKETVKEAVLTTKLNFLTEQVKNIDLKLDLQNKHFDTKFNEISSQYVTQTQLSELKNNLESKVEALRRDIEIFRKRVSLNYIMVAVLVALFTALIYSQFGGSHL
jgi:hypothetical protein